MTNMATAEIEDCPYCYTKTDTDFAHENGEKRCVVYCTNEEKCGAVGPHAPTYEEAIEKWNKVASAVKWMNFTREASRKIEADLHVGHWKLDTSSPQPTIQEE